MDYRGLVFSIVRVLVSLIIGFSIIGIIRSIIKRYE